MLSPYIGSSVHEHFGPSGGPHSVDHYGTDLSGTKVYRFNSLGFRCGEFRENAARKIYVCGCSYTLGTGLDVEETWPVLFSQLYAKHVGLRDDEICLMNFSQGGSSNRYIARTLIEQSYRHPPDLVIAHFSYIARTEFLLPTELFDRSDPRAIHIAVAPVGPWLASASLSKRWSELRRIPPPFRQAAKQITRWAKDYYAKIYDQSRAVYETLENILALQHFCSARGIDCLMCCADHEMLGMKESLDNSAIRALFQMVDSTRFLDFAMPDKSIHIDKAADDAHPGPRANRIFADRLLTEYVGIQSSSSALA